MSPVCRINTTINHRLSGSITGERPFSGPLRQRDCIAYHCLPHCLDRGGNITHLSGIQAFAGQQTVLTHGDLIFTPADGSVTFQGRREELTRNESRILHVLLENKGQIVSRDTLMARLWETDAFVDENTLSVNIARLRRKLDAVGAAGLIATRKGMGYIIP